MFAKVAGLLATVVVVMIICSLNGCDELQMYQALVVALLVMIYIEQGRKTER